MKHNKRATYSTNFRFLWKKYDKFLKKDTLMTKLSNSLTKSITIPIPTFFQICKYSHQEIPWKPWDLTKPITIPIHMLFQVEIIYLAYEFLKSKYVSSYNSKECVNYLKALNVWVYFLTILNKYHLVFNIFNGDG